MAEVKKARLFLRRGTDTDRKTTTLCEGELGYSTDAFRVVVGDGTTAGGKSLGTTVHVSGGGLGRHFYTKLVQASAYDGGTGGFAMQGDLAVFPARSYYKADGVTTSTPGPSATTVMLLTADVGVGNNASVGSSWVPINSAIPWGNLQVNADDITGDYISGGDISGDVTFSGTINTTKTTTTSAIVGSLAGTGNRNVFVTATGQLTAKDTTTDSKTADGTLKFVTTQSISSKNGTGAYTDWRTTEFTSVVPFNASVGLFQFVWDQRAASTTYDILMVRSSATGTTALTAVYEGPDGNNKGVGGSSQFYCPLSSNGTTKTAFDWKMYERSQEGSAITTAVFDRGFDFRLIGYM